MIRTRLIFIILICWLASPIMAVDNEIVVAAAADLSSVLPELAASYQKQTGNTVRLSFGSSGNITQQIKNGAPFDLFFSADEDYPKQLIEAGLAEPASMHRYAVGQLVLWVPASSALDIDHRGLDSLLDLSVQKIAIANPQHAPYGRAAEAALKHAQLYDRVARKLVFGENVSQAAQFVESGNAQAGLVALSHAMAPGMKAKGRYWKVPAAAYPELDQAAVVISHSAHKKQAAAFLDYMTTDKARALLQQYGFSLAGEKR